MKTLDISTKKFPGTFAMVDDEDFDQLNQWKWCRAGKLGYVNAHVTINGGIKSATMHRFIMGFPEGFDVDHKDRNVLNNTRANLRICTRGQNMANIPGRGASGFKGVLYRKDRKKYRAVIVYERTPIWLGVFDSAVGAAKAYNKKALELFGEFALLNAID